MFYNTDNVSVMHSFRQLHQNYALDNFLLVGNGCRIPCHHIINNFQNFIMSLNRCTFVEISTLSNFNSEKQEGIDISIWNSLCVSIKPHALHNNMATAADHNLTPFSHMVNQACHCHSLLQEYVWLDRDPTRLL